MINLNKKILIVSIFLILGFGILLVWNYGDKEETILTDAQKFNEEYMSLNGQKVNDYEYQSLNFEDDIPIKYASFEEIETLLTEGTGIIYFGFPECPWCRSALPVLFDAVKSNDIEEVLYLNIKNIRSNIDIVDGDIVVTKEGTDEYYRLLEILDEFLDEYTKVNSKGKDVSLGEKRLLAPTVVFIKDGVVQGVHVSTVESQLSGFNPLSEEQKKELFNIYTNYISQINERACGVEQGC